jgi:hypothetical protein
MEPTSANLAASFEDQQCTIYKIVILTRVRLDVPVSETLEASI